MTINWSMVGIAAKRVCKGALAYGSTVLVSRLLKTDNTVYDSAFAEYDDVISAILHSSMLSSDRATVTSMIPRNGDRRLYKAIILVVNSSMLTSDKIKTIRSLLES